MLLHLALISCCASISLLAQPVDDTTDVDVDTSAAAITPRPTPTTTPLYAVEETPWLYIGAYGGFSLIAYDAFLPPTVFNSGLTLPPSATFTTGDGVGGMAGFLIELPVGENFNIGARLGYQIHAGTLTQLYINSADVRGRDGSLQSASVQGEVEAKFGHVSATLYARVAPFSFPLYFYGGPTFLLPAQANYTYTERIGGPTGVVFRDPANRTTRTLASRDFPTAGTVLAVTAGLGYEHALSNQFGVFAEVQFQPMLADYLADLRPNEFWTGSSLSLVAGFRYGLISGPDAPPPPPVIARDTAVVVRRQTDTFSAMGVTPGGLSDTITVERRRVKATEVHALLPYIFFDRDADSIPARYIKYEARTRRNFQLERLPRGSTIDIYYQLLNIVGQRFRDDRIREITLTGCVSQFEEDTTLALRRAEAVRDYLVTVWRIPEGRIKVVARGLPANPSLSEVDTVEAARENQRVEISSEGFLAERPVQLPDTAFLEPIGTIRFLPPPTTKDTTGVVDSWALDVMIGDSLIRRAVSGLGSPPREIDFPIENRPDLDLRGPVSISSTLVIRDTLYQDLVRLKSTPVVVQPSGAYEEVRDVVDGRFVDTYNLLLYSFDSAQTLSFTNQATSLINPRIDSTSVVRIIGHTDRIGLPYYNQALSQRRAEFAQTLLNIQADEVVGRGEKSLLYDNTFPEGRYYSRTVTVIVETPIPGQTSEESGTQSQQRRRGTQRATREE
jgi:outer membrane protein OmpA-like peptidoglycan-associated protein